MSPKRGNKPVKIDTPNKHTLIYGIYSIDLSQVEQLVHRDQTRAIGWILYYFLSHPGRGEITVTDGLKRCLLEIQKCGLDKVTPYKSGDLAMPRLYEVAATLNRVRNANWCTIKEL